MRAAAPNRPDRGAPSPESMGDATLVHYVDQVEGFEGFLVIDGRRHSLAAGGLRLRTVRLLAVGVPAAGRPRRTGCPTAGSTA